MKKQIKKSLIERLLIEVANGCGDRAGCNDYDAKTARRWIKLSKSKNLEDQEILIDEVRINLHY